MAQPGSAPRVKRNGVRLARRQSIVGRPTCTDLKPKTSSTALSNCARSHSSTYAPFGVSNHSASVGFCGNCNTMAPCSCPCGMCVAGAYYGAKATNLLLRCLQPGVAESASEHLAAPGVEPGADPRRHPPMEEPALTYFR